MPVVCQQVQPDVSGDQARWQFIRHSRVLVSVRRERQRHVAVVANVLPHRAVEAVGHPIAGYPLWNVVTTLGYNTGGTCMNGSSLREPQQCVSRTIRLTRSHRANYHSIGVAEV